MLLVCVCARVRAHTRMHMHAQACIHGGVSVSVRIWYFVVHEFGGSL